LLSEEKGTTAEEKTLLLRTGKALSSGLNPDRWWRVTIKEGKELRRVFWGGGHLTIFTLEVFVRQVGVQRFLQLFSNFEKGAQQGASNLRPIRPCYLI